MHLLETQSQNDMATVMLARQRVIKASCHVSSLAARNQ